MIIEAAKEKKIQKETISLRWKNNLRVKEQGDCAESKKVRKIDKKRDRQIGRYIH